MQSWYDDPSRDELNVGNARLRDRSCAPAYRTEHILDFDPSRDEAAGAAMNPRMESAEQLREQAAACRRLSVKARTRAGTKALGALGDHFDEQARKLDPSSQRR
jgi:hypothetical protein